MVQERFVHGYYSRDGERWLGISRKAKLAVPCAVVHDDGGALGGVHGVGASASAAGAVPRRVISPPRRPGEASGRRGGGRSAVVVRMGGRAGRFGGRREGRLREPGRGGLIWFGLIWGVVWLTREAGRKGKEEEEEEAAAWSL